MKHYLNPTDQRVYAYPADGSLKNCENNSDQKRGNSRQIRSLFDNINSLFAIHKVSRDTLQWMIKHKLMAYKVANIFLLYFLFCPSDYCTLPTIRVHNIGVMMQ